MTEQQCTSCLETKEYPSDFHRFRMGRTQIETCMDCYQKHYSPPDTTQIGDYKVRAWLESGTTNRLYLHINAGTDQVMLGLTESDLDEFIDYLIKIREG